MPAPGNASPPPDVGAVRELHIGIDVGSTTVKCVVVDPATLRILWSRYERHETRQAAKLLELLEAIEAAFPHIEPESIRAYITGSGAGLIAPHINARFVQEVNAVTIAIEHLHPDVGSVIELGGQDAKIIVFKTNAETGERQSIASMNDKCASGTGATIDKCLLKLGMSSEELATLQFDPDKLHRVAAKCGVFAETDIVNLVKAGVPSPELMNSLANAIVVQNLSVLTRGNTLQPKVLLLGGPNAFLPFFRDCWRLRIPETWAERGYAPPAAPIGELILVPDNAQYYAAYGAAIFGLARPRAAGGYRGLESLRQFIAHGRKVGLTQKSGPGLLRDDETAASIERAYAVPEFRPALLQPGGKIRGYIGFDGGSTSSKAVLIDDQETILAKEYRLSGGNPVQDAKEILARIVAYAGQQNCSLEILGFGVTGYAADVLDSALHCDANIVETVAHMLSATRSFGGDVDVICDVGGQDIKVLFLLNGQVKSFRLSNQCSAGNGILLQAMARQFGIDVRDYADVAFKAELAPKFTYGCAVFLDTDRVNFQREGFSREELFAGLAQVLPKNIWQYVVQVPRLAELGRKFVLQGGTQRNLAAVKAQADYIIDRIPDAVVRVHPHCGEAGAIGAALEAKRVVERRGHSTFVGLNAAMNLEYTTTTNETTRCKFCENHCSRTFIDMRLPDGNATRYIAGFSCEKGTVESKEAVIRLNQARKQLKQRYPNLVAYEAELAFQHFHEPLSAPGSPIDDIRVDRAWLGYGPVRRRPKRRPFRRGGSAAAERRAKLRIGIPRCLGAFGWAPFLRTYLEALGVPPRQVVFSDETSEEMWSEGGRFGSIDPCFPSKVALAHIRHLLTHKHRHKPLDYLWFPSITDTPTFVSHTAGSTSCPILACTPSVALAAFTKERDMFAEAGVDFVRAPLNFETRHLLRQQLFETWVDRLGITEDESDWASEQGWRAMALYDQELQRRGHEILAQAERDNNVALLMIGRPYHGDSGLNHGVLEELQALGYPILSMRSIPRDHEFLAPLFADDLASGRIDDVFDVRDVWPENYSANSVQKVWAAKFAARHPNVAVLDLSSFKCGQDAPTYGLIDRIISASKTPYLALHDLDANKPTGSIKIRVKTYAYALGLYRERLADMAAKRTALAQALEAKRRELVERERVRLEGELLSASPDARRSLDRLFEAFLADASGPDDACDDTGVPQRIAAE